RTDNLVATLALDEQLLAIGERGQDVGQGRHPLVGELGIFPRADIERLQFLEGRLLDDEFLARYPFGISVVGAHNLTITRQVEVSLYPISSLLPRELEGSHGVFRGVVRGTA